ncbi:MAG: hypothetical protein WCJ37_01185 [Syntrophus sp. (in: bacteria)]
MILFNEVVSGKSQADGVFTVLLAGADCFARHQIQVEVSATPADGHLAVAMRSPGAEDFVTLDGAFDLASDDLVKVFGPAFVAEFQFTPTDFDAAKTYNVIVTSGEG